MSEERTCVRVFIGLGSNMNNPPDHVRKALQELKTLPATNFIAHSSLYRSAPMTGGDSPESQADYINAVAELETWLPALALLDNLQEIEARHGRDRSGAHWGPRTLDLDLLLYGDHRIVTDRLSVPHPGMFEREFVLYPLNELKPELQIPVEGQTETEIETRALADILANCPLRGLEKLENAAL